MTDDLEKLQAKQSEEAFDRWLAESLANSKKGLQNYQKTLSAIEKQMIGAFRGVPPKIADWVFYRVGQKVSQVTHAMAHMLRQQGWVDAPPSVKMLGVEFFDGEAGGLYLCAPQATYKRMKEIEQAAANKSTVKAEIESFDGLGEQLDGTSGVQVDQLDVQMSEMSVDDAQTRAAETAAVVRARRLSKRD